MKDQNIWDLFSEIYSTIVQVKPDRVPSWLKQNGKDLTILEGHAWYALHVSSRKEVSLAKVIEGMKVSIFLPLCQKSEYSVNNENKKFLPLWPGYIFARLTKDHLSIALQNKDILSYFYDPDQEELLDVLKIFPAYSKELDIPEWKRINVRLIGTSVNLPTGHGKVIDYDEATDKVQVRTQSGDDYKIEEHRAELIRMLNLSSLDLKDQISTDVICNYVEDLNQYREVLQQFEISKYLDINKEKINEKIVNYLSLNPSDLEKLTHEKFEELVLHLIADMGFEIEVVNTISEIDRQLLAKLTTPLGTIVVLIHCEINKKSIDLDVVERFMYSLEHKSNATYGIVVSTGSPTEKSIRMESTHKRRLQVHGLNTLIKWLEGYGGWKNIEEQNIWFPPKLELNNSEKHNNVLNAKDKRRHRIFLAHSSIDKIIVKELYSKLKEDGYGPWLDEKDIVGGQNWETEISRAIKSATVFLACFSCESIKKTSYANNELRQAMVSYANRPLDSIYLIPIRLDECKVPDIRLPDLGLKLEGIHHINFYDVDGYKKLLESIEMSIHTENIRSM